MTIARITLDVVQHDVEPISVTDSRMELGGPSVNGILRILTTGGVEGQCIVGSFGDDPTWQIEQIKERIGPKLIGREVSSREWLWNQLDAITSHGLPVHTAWAWVDLALWDLLGKEAGLPVSDLLGRSRDFVPVLATHPPRHESARGYVEEAASLRALGFKAIKLHPGNLSAREVSTAALAARDQVGEEVELVLDANNSYSLAVALEVGRGLDEADFGWFEDPVPASRIGSIEKLFEQIRTPIALGDESSVLFREGVHLMVQHGLPIVRTSSRKLGVTGSARLAVVADALDRRCEIGVGGNPSANSANLALAAMTLHGHYEHWLPTRAQQFATETVVGPFEDGTIRPLTGNGLGIDLDEDWITAHRVGRTEIAS